MPYSALQSSKRIYPHNLSRRETRAAITRLLQVGERELRDSEAEGVSRDGRYEHAYGGVRALAEVAMTAEGYRPAGRPGQHQVLFEFLGLIPSARWQADATYFDTCRQKRNRAAYAAPGLITETELEELIAEAESFTRAVAEWLRRQHSPLAR